MTNGDLEASVGCNHRHINPTTREESPTIQVQFQVIPFLNRQQRFHQPPSQSFHQNQLQPQPGYLLRAGL